MLILTRASQDAVVTALAEVDADVGPTSGAGLTAVWCTGDEPVRALTPLADLVAVWDEPDEGHAVLHLSHDGGDSDCVWPLSGAVEPALPSSTWRADVADALSRFFASTPRGDLAADLGAVRQAEDLTEVLAAHFHLPDLDPVHRRSVTVHHGRSADARIAGRLTARDGSGVAVVPLGERWTALRADHPAVQQVVSLAVAAAGSRRAVVLHLWRGDDDAAGFELLHREHVVAHGSWDDGWRRTIDEDWPARDAAADMLARRVGGDVDMSALRALLRSRTRTGDPLARLVELLGVPAAALDVLDGTASAPTGEPVEPAGWFRAVREETRAEAAGRFGVRRPRWLQLLAAAVAGLFSLLALVFGVAMVATDGALLDQHGATVGDWLILPVAVAGVGLSTWVARRAVRSGQVL